MKHRLQSTLALVAVLALALAPSALRAQDADWELKVKDVFNRYVTEVGTATVAVQKAASAQELTASCRDLIKSMAPVKATFREIAASHPEIKSDKGLGKVLGKDQSKQVEKAYTDLFKAIMPVAKKNKNDADLKAALDEMTRAITFTGDKA